MTQNKSSKDPTRLSKFKVLELIHKSLSEAKISKRLNNLLLEKIENGLEVYPGDSVTQEFAYELIFSFRHLLQHGIEGLGTRPGRKFEPIDIEEFVCSSDYMGQKDFVRPAILSELKRLFDGDRYRYTEVVLGGCLSYDSLICEADGGLPSLQDRLYTANDVLVIKDSGIEISTTDGTRPSGKMKALQIDLTNGMRLKCSYDHKVHIYRNGYKMVPANELSVGDFVVCPRKLQTIPSVSMQNEEARLLAYWCANGSYERKRSRCSSGNTNSIDDALFCLQKLGFDGSIAKVPNEECNELYVFKNVKSGFYNWIKHRAVRGTKNVIVPDRICRSDTLAISHFLNALWAMEGTVYEGSKEGSPPRFYLAMIAERFIRQIQLLLLRFGIQSRIRLNRQFDKRSGRTTYMWELVVQGVHNLKKFLSNIGYVLGKEKACESIRNYCCTTKANTNVDLIPLTYGELSDLMASSNIVRGRKHRWNVLGTARKSKISRTLFDEWLHDYRSTILGRKLSKEYPKDLSFTPIKSIVPIQDKILVGDIGAYNGNRYIANGISVHNSIGSGKNYFTDMAMAYVIYDLSSYYSPQLEFGLAPGSSIVFMMQSASIKLAKSVMYNQFKARISLCPYFIKCFPFDKKVKTELRFPNDIIVVPLSSTDTAALGMNIFGGAQDELSFMPVIARSKKASSQNKVYDQAATLYNAVIRRIESRFLILGKVPGKLFLIGSANYPGNFIDRKIQDTKLRIEAGEKVSTFTMSMAQWESLPKDRFSEGVFRIELPSENSAGKILEEGEEPSLGAEVKNVPIDYKERFQVDFEGSLRDIAGIAVGSVSKFIRDVDKIILAATKHGDIFNKEQLFTLDTMDQRSSTLVDDIVNMKYIEEYLDSDTKFGVHIDLALTGDSAGVAVGRVFGFKKKLKETPEEEEQKSEPSNSLLSVPETLPVFCIDGALSILPPPNREIDLFMIRDLILFLKRHINIVFATLDSYESAMMMQSFRSHRISSTVQSVDRSPQPYKDFKTAILTERILYPNHPVLLKEVKSLIRDPITGKIDHPPGGSSSKDVSDCAAGIVHKFSRSRISYRTLDGKSKRPVIAGNRPKGGPRPSRPSKQRKVRMDSGGRLI